MNFYVNICASLSSLHNFWGKTQFWEKQIRNDFEKSR